MKTKWKVDLRLPKGAVRAWRSPSPLRRATRSADRTRRCSTAVADRARCGTLRVVPPKPSLASRIVTACALIGAVSCAKSCAPSITPPSTSTWPEADALFLNDDRFLGGDAAYTTTLPNDRVLWLFGDTFVSTSPMRTRSLSRMVKNSVAVQTGHDPSSATMQFFFGGDVEGGEPRAFFGDDGDDWLWPGHPLLLGENETGPLLLFFWRV